MFLLNNLVLVAMAFVVLWGTFFPLISEAITGQEASVGPPWFDRYTVPLALVLVLLSGIGPVIAWRRATAVNLRRNLLKPALAGVAVLVVLGALGLGSEPLALAMFGLAAFVLGALWQELWRGVRARRAMSSDGVPRAVVSLVRRNRRRYGGYLVHAGVSVLFVGIAASSAFQDEREVQLTPGQTTRVGAYDVTYVRPTADLRAAGNGRLEKIDLGAVLKVTRDGEPVTTMRTVKSFFPSAAPMLGPVSRFFEGESTSEVGLKAGFRRDVWAAVAPDTSALRPRVAEGDKVFSAAELTPEQHDTLLAQALDGLTRSYAKSPPPATFRLIVSPMVTWIWLGAHPRLPGRPDRPVADPARHDAPRERRVRRARWARRAHPHSRVKVDLLLVVVVLALIVLVVGAPLRRRGVREVEETAEHADLMAAREAKYREIRDAELDHRTGKLSDADWRAQDRALRAQAVEILRRLDDYE